MMAPPSMKAQLELLGAVPLFSLTGKKQLRAIAEQFKLQKVPEGKQLTEQGEYGREFYVVVSGSARCEVDGREIRKFGPGSFFGELALLAGGPRSATIVAETPMELLVLDRRDFTFLVRVQPDVAVKILASVAARLQSADRQVTN
jgi:CRP/FNR family transcriptional regulator, cyclic AMP receptor protein